jgi:orotate phosphoribosyltransferase-like protein
MSKLNKTQKYAIQWLHSTGLDSDAIAKELNLTPQQVLPLIPKVEVVENSKTTSIASAKDLMITHTSGKKINSVAIMTKEASQIGDESKKSAPQINIEDKKGIFRPKK